jgi:hypothetical protein
VRCHSLEALPRREWRSETGQPGLLSINGGRRKDALPGGRTFHSSRDSWHSVNPAGCVSKSLYPPQLTFCMRHTRPARQPPCARVPTALWLAGLCDRLLQALITKSSPYPLPIEHNAAAYMTRSHHPAPAVHNYHKNTLRKPQKQASFTPRQAHHGSRTGRPGSGRGAPCRRHPRPAQHRPMTCRKNSHAQCIDLTLAA